MSLANHAQLNAAFDKLASWARSHALPMWHIRGQTPEGGFHETIAEDLSSPVVPRRSRVIGRQLYCYSIAPDLGWTGDWQQIVSRGFEFQLDRMILPDGTTRNLMDADFTPTDDSFVLYNQAFALFGWAAVTTAAKRMGSARLGAKAHKAAVKLRNHLVKHYRHPMAGFYEDLEQEKPLEANPHMHLFEACLVWEQIDGDPFWPALADEIAELALTRLISEEGWLREHFKTDWTPLDGLQGQIVEPGHMFEWAWLLVRWGKLRNRPEAITVARKMTKLTERHGVDASRNVAMMAILDDATVHDPKARLWAQTERLKCHLTLASVYESEVAMQNHVKLALRAIDSINAYLDRTPEGLWWDSLSADGTFADQAAPASTFYHLIGAICVLQDTIHEGSGTAKTTFKKRPDVQCADAEQAFQ